MTTWTGAEEITSLLEEQDVEVLVRSRLALPPFLTGDPRRTSYWRRNRDEFAALTERYGREIAEGRIAPVTVRPAGEGRGLGLFAAADLEEGTFVGEYAGLIRRAGSTRPRPLPDGGFASDYAWSYPRLRWFSPSLDVDARTAGNALRFINHSFHPAAEADHTALPDEPWTIFFRLIRPVSAGDEITIDYGEEYWAGGYRELVPD